MRQTRADDRSTFRNIVKYFTNLKFGDYIIWNHHEKYIEISTKISSIGFVICEIGFQIEEQCEQIHSNF